MDGWLELARGPVFIFALVFMLLGLARHAAITLIEIGRVYRRAGDKAIPFRKIFLATVKWMVPITVIKNRLVYSLTSVVFHISVLVVPIFLAGHILLWTRGLGIAYPAIPNIAADILTIIAVITGSALILQRVSARATRALSRKQDFILPLLVITPFLSGFFVMHPSLNPFSYEATLFIHVMSANILFILIPLTKLSHAVLIPTVQLVSELAWHWPSDSGGKVGAALGKQEEPI